MAPLDLKRILGAPELLVEWCRLLARQDCLGTILALAMTCHDVRPIALEELWAYPPSLLCLIKTLPSEVISVSDAEVVSAGSHAEMQRSDA